MLMKVARTAVRLEVRQRGQDGGQGPLCPRQSCPAGDSATVSLGQRRAHWPAAQGPGQPPFWQGAAGAPPPGFTSYNCSLLWSQTLQTTVLCG